MFALCGATPSAAKAPFVTSHGLSTGVRLERAASQEVPETKRPSLLYVSDAKTNAVYVFSYPNGVPIGTLTGFSQPAGLCADGAGDVWIADLGAQQLVEYAHGGSKRIATLKDPNYYPNACSVDPTSGNLAVANMSMAGSSGSGSIAIYEKAHGAPKIYTDPSLYFIEYCGYDAKGNLYADGFTSSSAFLFAELPHGNRTFTDIMVPQRYGFLGPVQWDGTHVALGGGKRIYQVAIRGKNARILDVTPLHHGDVLAFWIQRPRVIGVNPADGTVRFWRYPNGGAPTKTLTGFSDPVGVTVSLGT